MNQTAIEQTNSHQTTNRAVGYSDVSQIPGSDLRNGKRNEIEGQESQKGLQSGFWANKSTSLSRLGFKLSDVQWQPEGNSSEVI
jgi:hypothetical protein